MKTLKDIFDEDQRDRNEWIKKYGKRNDKEAREAKNKIWENDKRRLTFAKNYLKKSKKLSAGEYYCAALVFHHSPYKTNNKKAVKLAKLSLDQGYERAAKLLALTIQRASLK